MTTYTPHRPRREPTRPIPVPYPVTSLYLVVVAVLLCAALLGWLAAPAAVLVVALGGLLVRSSGVGSPRE